MIYFLSLFVTSTYLLLAPNKAFATMLTFTLLTTVLTFIVPNFDSDARLQRVPTYFKHCKAFPTRIIYHSSSTFILQKIVFLIHNFYSYYLHSRVRNHLSFDRVWKC
jgi:hypothetical protein